MAKEYKLEVEKRESTRKSDLKQYRKEGKIPGVYYSTDSKKSTPFYIIYTDLISAFKSGSHLYEVNVGGKTRNVIFKEVQYHPVTDEILHIDLYGVKMDEKITVKVSINLTGDAEVYKVTMTRVELCEGSTCSTPTALCTTSKTVDIASVNAGTDISVTGTGTTTDPYVINNAFVEIDADPTNEYNTSAALTGTDLTIVDGGGTQTVDLASLVGSDDQNIAGSGLTGTDITR